MITCSEVPLLYEDDQILFEELRSLGLKVKPVVWDDPSVDWSVARVSVIRSVWDYYWRHAEFLDWLQRVAGRAQLYNSPQMIAWNSHKSYLRQLEEKGIPTVETAWLSGGEIASLGELLKNRSWEEAIIKPAVSASAFKTQRVSLRDALSLTSGQDLVNELSRQGEVMIQPYLRALETEGERSLIFIAGRYTHTVVRQPALTHGREQSARGEIAAATQAELRLAEQVIASLETIPLYARVDLVNDPAGGKALLELELIEPVLFFRHSRAAARQMAEEILKLTN